MHSESAAVALRRADDERGLRRLVKGKRSYDVRFDDGSTRRLSMRRLDKLLNARTCPADFWACVEAADKARAEGDMDAMFEWLGGKRVVD